MNYFFAFLEAFIGVAGFLHFWINRGSKLAAFFVAIVAFAVAAAILTSCTPTAPVEQTCTNTVSAHGRDTVVIIPCKTARVGREGEE